MNKKKKIIIIDSGIGGLYIYKNINFYKNNYIYVMDNYGFPYGNKNYLYILNRILNIINYLKKIYKIILLIIACNTASIITYKYIKKKFKFPIIGTFPNIKKSIKKTKNNLILLLGTYITINSSYINNIIINIKKKKIIKIYSSKLVKISEKKIKFNKKINTNIIKNIIFLKLKKKNPDTIIIGCTHFGFIKKELKKIFLKKITFIDNIKEIKKKIIKYKNLTNNKNKKTKNLFFYTKKENFKKIFILKLKKKYKFNYLKKIKI